MVGVRRSGVTLKPYQQAMMDFEEYELLARRGECKVNGHKLRKDRVIVRSYSGGEMEAEDCGPIVRCTHCDYSFCPKE